MNNKTTAERRKTKQQGQVFTPRAIVESMLGYCGYEGAGILRKHVMDNSCGDGAFLRVMLRRYIEAARAAGLTPEAIKHDLETYIHGIDNDAAAYEACRAHLSDIAAAYGIRDVAWDLRCESALTLRQYDGQMDFVVGNPPYVRVHNLEATYDDVKAYKFAEGGMTDLYLAFFELGFRMLSPEGRLCYITPSSWLGSVAADTMRRYILQHRNLVALIDLGHYQAFDGATAYTMISLFEKHHGQPQFDYYTYDGVAHERTFVARLSLAEAYIDTCFYLSDAAHLGLLREIKTAPARKYVSVKNGFATLADGVFIGSHIPPSPITIRVLKGSTGQWYNGLFPYDKAGKPLSESEVFASAAVKAHLLSAKSALLKGKAEHPGWYLYGRTQALADVYRPKLSVNTLIRSERDFKLTRLRAGEGIYSGLYVITDFDIDFGMIARIIASEDFVAYVKLLKKYKSGGYYTFSSKDLAQYLNYYLTYKTGQTNALRQSVLGRHPDLFQGVYQ